MENQENPRGRGIRAPFVTRRTRDAQNRFRYNIIFRNNNNNLQTYRCRYGSLAININYNDRSYIVTPPAPNERNQLPTIEEVDIRTRPSLIGAQQSYVRGAAPVTLYGPQPFPWNGTQQPIPHGAQQVPPSSTNEASSSSGETQAASRAQDSFPGAPIVTGQSSFRVQFDSEAFHAAQMQEITSSTETITIHDDEPEDVSNTDI